MPLYLGIDGGQSGTTCLIGDETSRVVGRGAAGPSNHAAAAEGRRKFVSAIGESLEQAALQAGVPHATFAAACLGLSGGPADKEELVRELIRAETFLITHDAAIALAGATAGRPGIITIAGTGSIAFGKNPEGRAARAGGWGYVFGDEGGAFDLVRKALRAVLRHEEGWGPKTALREMLLARCGAADANALMHSFYADDWPRARVAALAPLVEEAAQAGDAVAQEILAAAAQSLATLTAAVRRQLFTSGSPVDVRHSGGAFRARALLERFRMLVEIEDGCRVAAPLFGPAEGALLEAYRIGGLPCEAIQE